MTIEEKRDLLKNACNGSDCDRCFLDKYESAWCKHYTLLDCPEAVMDGVLGLVEDTTTTPQSTNPYWDNISKLAADQRGKGIQEYGQGLEKNQANIFDRINHIEEELIDALMYLEWLKDGLGGIRQWFK